jgi:glutamate formiminotransferase/formiminotetrahydrofolate cyclodeaminase
MVANLTVGKKGYESVQAELKEAAIKAQAAKAEMLRAIDEDTGAFDRVMEAHHLPGGSEDQTREKEVALQRAYIKATQVPLGVLEKSVALLELAKTAARKGNKNSLSDAGVAALAAEAAAVGARYNVLINLPNIPDDMFREDVKRRAQSLLEQAAKLAAEVKELVAGELEKA